MNKIEEKLLKVWTDAWLPAEQFSLDMPSMVFAMRTSIGRARRARIEKAIEGAREFIAQVWAEIPRFEDFVKRRAGESQ